LKEEKATLEGIVKSHDELTTEITKEIGIDCMGEDAEDKDEDGNDGGDATVTPVAVAPPLAPAPPVAAAPEEVLQGVRPYRDGS
jgi:hypothetical protein